MGFAFGLRQRDMALQSVPGLQSNYRLPILGGQFALRQFGFRKATHGLTLAFACHSTWANWNPLLALRTLEFVQLDFPCRCVFLAAICMASLLSTTKVQLNWQFFATSGTALSL